MRAGEIISIIYNISYAEERRDTVFGFGFHRWVGSWKIVEKTGLTYSEIRRLFQPIIKEGLLEYQGGRGSFSRYSLTGIEDCKIVGDYFIEIPEKEGN